MCPQSIVRIGDGHTRGQTREEGGKPQRYKEYPVQIIYTEYSIAKGQKISNAINILIDLLFGRISK